MMGSQSGPESGAATVRTIRSAAEPLVAAGLAAHGAAVALMASSAQPPLMTALVATLVFAGISLAYGRRPWAVVGPADTRLQLRLAADATVVVIVWAGVWLVGRVLGTGSAFYCEPLVPWRIELAFFGGFGIAYFTVMARQRDRAREAYPLVVLALLWIAPFYGFFSAPLFLGISLNTMCASRPIVTAALTAVGMRVGEQLGLAVAAWIYSAPPRRDT